MGFVGQHRLIQVLGVANSSALFVAEHHSRARLVSFLLQLEVTLPSYPVRLSFETIATPALGLAASGAFCCPCCPVCGIWPRGQSRPRTQLR